MTHSNKSLSLTRHNLLSDIFLLFFNFNIVQKKLREKGAQKYTILKNKYTALGKKQSGFAGLLFLL